MDSAACQKPAITINQNVGNVTDSYKNIWNNCEISVSDEKRQILEWLSPMAPRERHQAVREGRVEGVGNWLLRTNEFQKWHTSEDQAVHPLLFRYGDPGVGKTYLSSLVIDTLCDRLNGGNMVVACIYCDFHADKGQSATSVLAALLKQLVAGVEPIPEEIKGAYDRAKREVDGRALRLPEIRAMLTKSASLLLRGFICVDALDEFPANHRPELWDSLRHIVRECPNIRLFITGRPHIREEVRKYFPGCTDQPPIKPTEEDIREYLTMRLKEDLELDAMDTELKADILGIIPKKISGAFLLVSLVMDAVMADATIHQRRQTLNRMTNGFGLDDAYGRTLDRIRAQKGNRMKLGMEALMWVSCSKRQLKAGELCQALGVELRTADINVHNVPTIRTLLSCTLGLVTIDEQASTVRLVHFTLQEYLVAHPNLFTTPHSMMAETCLTYLNFKSVCDLSTALDTLSSTMPFLQYASCCWGFHAEKEMGKDVKCLALQLFEQDADHIWVDILLREESVGFLSWGDRLYGRSPDIRGFTGLHGVAYMGITEAAVSMVEMKRWDLNGRDSKGQTPLAWAVKYENFVLAKALLGQLDVQPTLSDKQGLTPLIHAVRSGHEQMVKFILEYGDVNPDSPDERGRTPLSYAAEYGHEGVVKILLERKDVNPNSPSNDGRTPLSFASRSGREGVAKMLLELEDVNPDSGDNCGQTPLSHAAEYGHEGVVKILLERTDVNPNSLDKYGYTAVSYAAGAGHEGVVELLLQQGNANPNLWYPDSLTLLSAVARQGHEGLVKMLLARGDVDPDLPDATGRTPLSHAAEEGSEDVVRLLLQRRDVDPNLPDNNDMTPLMYAAQSGHEDVLELLLERVDFGPISSDNGGMGALRLASQCGHAGAVNLLFEEVDVDRVDCGPEALACAARSGCEDLVELLLERGYLDPNWSDEDGRTQLSYAAQGGCEPLVKLLLERGDIDPNLPDVNGLTPLSCAARYASESGVKLLLQRGDVNPNTPDCDNKTPLHHAVHFGFKDVVRVLLERRDVDPNLLWQRGRTPLSLAVFIGNEGVVKLLLAREDVNPNLPNWDGRTPLSLAAEDGCENIVKLLLERRDVDSDSPDQNGLTPLSYATMKNDFGIMRLLSKPRPSSHERSKNSDVTHESSVLALSAREEVGLTPVLQQETAIPDARHKVTDVIPLVHSDEPSSNQLAVRPSTSSTPSTSYWSTILEPSGPQKRPIADQTHPGPSKRQRSHLS